MNSDLIDPLAAWEVKDGQITSYQSLQHWSMLFENLRDRLSKIFAGRRFHLGHHYHTQMSFLWILSSPTYPYFRKLYLFETPSTKDSLQNIHQPDALGRISPSISSSSRHTINPVSISEVKALKLPVCLDCHLDILQFFKPIRRHSDLKIAQELLSQCQD